MRESNNKTQCHNPPSPATEIACQVESPAAMSRLPAISDIERILSEAVEIASAAERQAFIDRACTGNGELR